MTGGGGMIEKQIIETLLCFGYPIRGNIDSVKYYSRELMVRGFSFKYKLKELIGGVILNDGK